MSPPKGLFAEILAHDIEKEKALCAVQAAALFTIAMLHKRQYLTPEEREILAFLELATNQLAALYKAEAK